MMLKSKNELDNHAHKDHNTGAERREENLFQRLKNKIVPIEPNEEFKCGKFKVFNTAYQGS